MDAWIWIAALAGIVGAVATVAWRGESTRRAALESERTALEEALEAAREEAASRKGDHGARDRELQDLRRKLEKAKRRARDTREDHTPMTARLRDVEEALAARVGELAHARDEAARFEAALAGASQEAARAKAALIEARKVPAPPKPDAELKWRSDAAEEEARRLSAKCREFERDLSRHRQQARTYRRLYGMIQGELELAKEKVRHLQGLPPSKRPRAPAAAEAGASAETRADLEAAVASVEAATSGESDETGSPAHS